MTLFGNAGTEIHVFFTAPVFPLPQLFFFAIVLSHIFNIHHGTQESRGKANPQSGFGP